MTFVCSFFFALQFLLLHLYTLRMSHVLSICTELPYLIRSVIKVCCHEAEAHISAIGYFRGCGVVQSKKKKKNYTQQVLTQGVGVSLALVVRLKIIAACFCERKKTHQKSFLPTSFVSMECLKIVNLGYTQRACVLFIR